MILLAMALALATWVIRRHRRDPKPPTPPGLRVILLLLLVELRSGKSVLAAVQNTAALLPEDEELSLVARVAMVSGLTTAMACAGPRVRPVVAQLARAQRTGASLSATVRRLIDDDLAAERAAQLTRARALPARLMIPMTLLMLPGMVLFLYAPALVRLYQDLIGQWS